MKKAFWLLGSIATLGGAALGCSSAGTTGSGGATATAGSGLGGKGAGGHAPTCDPFSAKECASGQSCDIDLDGLPHCFPPPNHVKLCGVCGVDPGDGGTADYCDIGLTCLDSNRCAAFCCDDKDCGAGGTCNKTFLGSPSIGVCTDGAVIADAGAGDAGSPVTQPACKAPAQPPSMGKCYKP